MFMHKWFMSANIYKEEWTVCKIGDFTIRDLKYKNLIGVRVLACSCAVDTMTTSLGV